jgi:hypothetical protein
MKKVALVTDRRNSQLGDVLIDDLQEVLGGCVELRSYFFEVLKPGESIQADLILVTTQSKALEIQNHVAEAAAFWLSSGPFTKMTPAASSPFPRARRFWS